MMGKGGGNSVSHSLIKGRMDPLKFGIIEMMEQEVGVTDLKWEGLMAVFSITVLKKSRPDFLVKHLDIIFLEKQQNIQTNIAIL